MVEDGNLQWLKQFEGLNKRMNNLEHAYKISLKAMDSINLKLSDTIRYYVSTKGDTIKFTAKNWKYKDEWGDFKFEQISPDSGEFKYLVNVPLSGVTYWDRKWFLGKKRYKTEVHSDNPHIKLSELIDIKVVKNNRK